MRVLLDTNVLIAAFISHGVCSDLLEHCFQSHEIVTSEELVGEFRRTLSDKLRFSRTDAREAVGVLRGMVRIAKPKPLESPVCRDPEDDHVLAAGIGGEAACIITGDEDLLIHRSHAGIPILPPRQFWYFEQSRAEELEGDE